MIRAMMNNAVAFLVIGTGIATAQVKDSIPDTQIEPPEAPMEASRPIVKDTTNNFKKFKLDGIAAVVGDYVILNSDIEKTLIDLRNQGRPPRM